MELRNRELRAIKREMRDLKKSIEETTEDKEEIQLALTRQSADVSDAESVDEDEGGVVLAAELIAPTEKISDACEYTYNAPQEMQEAGHGMITAKQVKPSKMETKENQKVQRALKRQLLEDSTAESSVMVKTNLPAAVGEFEEGESSKAAFGIRGRNKAPSREAQDHNKALQAGLDHTRGVIRNMEKEAESKEEENKKLKAENHFAQLEVGYIHGINAGYRAAAEDDNPARTAHLDGLLKHKDAAFAELEHRAADCAETLAEAKTQRAVGNAHHEGQIRGLKRELAHRLNINQALTDGKQILQAQNDHVAQLFRQRIHHPAAIDALLHDHDAIQQDNAFLIKMITERHCYVLDAETRAAALQAAAITADHAAACAERHHRQTQQSRNGLVALNHDLAAKLDIMQEMRDERAQDLEQTIRQQAADLALCLRSPAEGANDVLTARLRTQEARARALSAELERAQSVAGQWRLRAMEREDGFCPMFGCDEVVDWGSEEVRWRVREAERRVGMLGREVVEAERKGKEGFRVGIVVGGIGRRGRGRGGWVWRVGGVGKGREVGRVGERGDGVGRVGKGVMGFGELGRRREGMSEVFGGER